MNALQIERIVVEEGGVVLCSDTCRSDDVAESMLWVLSAIGAGGIQKALEDALDAVRPTGRDSCIDAGGEAQDRLQRAIEDAVGAIETAVPSAWVGMSDGDGACWGIWRIDAEDEGGEA